MNNIIEYKDWLFVKVPNVEGWEIRGEHSERPYQLLSFYGEAEAIQLPPGSYQIIGKGDQLKEQDWEGIAEAYSDEAPFKNFKNYYNDLAVKYFLWAKQSGNSLLKSLGMEPSETLVLKKQTKLK